MNLYIETRVLNIADYIIETGATVRAAAGVFGVSKSTVHKDRCGFSTSVSGEAQHIGK